MAFTPVKSDMLGNVKVHPHPLFPPPPARLTHETTENPRPPTRSSPRISHSSRSSNQRAQNKKAHRNRGLSLASSVLLPPHFTPLPSPILPSPPHNIQLTPHSQRSRFHIHSPLPKYRHHRRRTISLLPQRLRQHAETAPLIHGEAHLQRRHERLPVPKRFLC